MPDDEPGLVMLRSLNARLEALYDLRWREDGQEDPSVAIAIAALEVEAAALIQARTERTMVPLEASHEAAVAEASRLLNRDAPEPSGRATGLVEAVPGAQDDAAQDDAERTKGEP